LWCLKVKNQFTMVHSNNTKKCVNQYLKNKLPGEIINYILSFENEIQNLLPIQYHQKHTEFMFIPNKNRWIGIDYYCGVKFMTIYSIVRKNKPDLSFDERKQEYRGLDVGEPNMWISISWNHRYPVP